MTSSARAWSLWSLVAVAYALAVFQRSAPQTFVDRLMADYDVGASAIGVLASAYFFGYMAMQLPAGVLADRWGVRVTVLTSLSISTAATLWFVHTSGLVEAAASRALVGIGDAMVFSSLMKLVSHAFPAARFGVMASLSQVAGCVGALCATAPLALAVGAIGWRASFKGLVVVLAVDLVVAAAVLRERSPAPADPAVSLRRMLRASLDTLRRVSPWGPVITWLGAYVASVSIFGVWGVALLTQGYGLSRTAASVQMFSFMASYMIGTLLCGHLVDTWFATFRRPLTLIVLARIALLIALTPAVGIYLPLSVTMACVVLLGFVAGAVVPLVWSSLRLAVAPTGIATAVGLTLAIGNLGAAVAQPVLGALLDRHWSGEVLGGAKLYTPAGYTTVLLVLAGVSVVSIIGARLAAEKPRSPQAVVAGAVVPQDGALR